MKPLLIPKTRFIAWLVATAIGFSLLTIKGEVPLLLGSLLLSSSSFLVMTRSERRRRPTKLDYLLGAAVLLLFLTVILALSRLIPLHYGQMALSVLRHPAFLIPLWMLLALSIHRRLERTEGQSHSP